MLYDFDLNEATIDVYDYFWHINVVVIVKVLINLIRQSFDSVCEIAKVKWLMFQNIWKIAKLKSR